MDKDVFGAARVFFVLILFVLLIQACASKTDESESEAISTIGVKKFVLNNPEQCVFEITNTANKSSSFSLQVNEKIPYTVNEIAVAVRKMPVEFENEPLERKAWRYVRDNIKFNTAFSEQKWQHNPHLLLNSLGFGQCDDYAALLAQLWEKLGFETRIWGLEGHVVNEIKIDGRWQMYDATYGVYYLNKNRQVAGVEELSLQHSLIDQPIEFMPFSAVNDYSAQFARYKRSTIEKYATQENNTISHWFITDVQEVDSQITIPALTSIRFPLKYKSKQLNLFYNSALAENKFVNYLNVYVPKGITGSVKLPLVIASVTGEGSVELFKNTYKIDELNQDLLRTEFIDNIIIKENLTGINIAYFVNSETFKLHEKNTIAIKSNKPQNFQIDTLSIFEATALNVLLKVDVEAAYLKEEFKARPYIKKEVAEINYWHFVRQKHNWVDLLSKMETIDDLNGIVSIYYKTQKGLNEKSQRQEIVKIHEKIAYLIQANKENEELIMQICKRSDLMYFINIVESNDADEVLVLLETIKEHIKL